MLFSHAAIVLAYEKGSQAARAGQDRCPFAEPEDWRRASAWRQGWRGMREMMDDARDLGEP